MPSTPLRKPWIAFIPVVVLCLQMRFALAKTAVDAAVQHGQDYPSEQIIDVERPACRSCENWAGVRVAKPKTMQFQALRQLTNDWYCRAATRSLRQHRLPVPDAATDVQFIVVEIPPRQSFEFA